MEATNERENEIRFGDLWSVFKRCWVIVLVVAILAGALSFGAMYLTHKDAYTATATIWALGNNASATGKTSTSDVSIGTYLINDYKELILTDNVLEEAIERTGSENISIGSLRSNITVTNNEDTRVMYVSVTAGEAAEAKELANAVSEVFCELVNAKSDEGKALVSVWDHAREPKQISNPISLIFAVLIALVAAIAVYAVFLIIHLMDDKINTASDVERYLGLNLLGVIPNREDARRRGMKKKMYYSYGSTKKN